MPTFPKHESYQTTDVGWIESIPAHWGLKKNKFLLKEKKKTVGVKSDDFTLLSLTLNGLIARDMENPQGKFPADFNNYKIVEPDNLVFCLFDIEETPRTVGHASLRGMITGAYDIFECGSELESKYLYYYYLSLDFDKRLQPLYSGLRKVIKLDTFLGVKSPVPPLEEQKRIVEFLDRTTTEIDRAIAQKQRLIELLQEQKAILINQAVTKGLNPNTPMRDSGIEWIGEIPDHWQVLRMKQLVKEICDGPFGSGLTSAHYSESGARVIRLQNIGEMIFKDTNRAYISFSYYLKLKKHSVKKGDLLIAGLGDEHNSLGRSCVYPHQNGWAIVKADCFRARVTENMEAKYVASYLSSYSGALGCSIASRGSTRARINIEITKNLVIPIPPHQEQIEISARVHSLIFEFQKIMDQIRVSIERLNELKKGFISEAVTGKIKV